MGSKRDVDGVEIFIWLMTKVVFGAAMLVVLEIAVVAMEVFGGYRFGTLLKYWLGW